MIMSYWHNKNKINLRLQLTLTPTPSLALLGTPDDEQRSHHSKLLILYLLYYAKKAMVNAAALPLYKMTYSNRGCHWKFEKVWSPWTLTLALI